MDDETGPITVASAAVVPSHDDDEREQGDRLKRRQLGPPQPITEGSKRQRLDDLEPVEVKEEGAVRTPAAEENLREARRRSGAEEERKRGKRLFGALLGTIGKFQKDSSSQRARSNAVKRKEVEEKLQEKLKQQTEEIDERKKKEDDDENLKKRILKRDFEENAMRIRHSNMRARANMLATSASPKLYYLPWKLLPSEESAIKSQLEDAENAIVNETCEFDRLRAKDEEDLKAAGTSAAKLREELSSEYIGQSNNANEPQETTSVEEKGEVEALPDGVPHEGANNTGGDGAEERCGNGDVGDAHRNSDLGDTAELIDGGEDTVIY